MKIFWFLKWKYFEKPNLNHLHDRVTVWPSWNVTFSGWERNLWLASAGDHSKAGSLHHRGQPPEEGRARRQSDTGGFWELQEQICPAKLSSRRGNKVRILRILCRREEYLCEYSGWFIFNIITPLPSRNTFESQFLKRYQKTCLPRAPWLHQTLQTGL